MYFLVDAVSLVKMKALLILLSPAHMQAVPLNTETRDFCRSFEERNSSHLFVLLCVALLANSS